MEEYIKDNDFYLPETFIKLSLSKLFPKAKGRKNLLAQSRNFENLFAHFHQESSRVIVGCYPARSQIERMAERLSKKLPGFTNTFLLSSEDWNHISFVPFANYVPSSFLEGFTPEQVLSKKRTFFSLLRLFYYDIPKDGRCPPSTFKTLKSLFSSAPSLFHGVEDPSLPDPKQGPSKQRRTKVKGEERKAPSLSKEEAPKKGKGAILDNPLHLESPLNSNLHQELQQRSPFPSRFSRWPFIENQEGTVSPFLLQNPLVPTSSSSTSVPSAPSAPPSSFVPSASSTSSFRTPAPQERPRSTHHAFSHHLSHSRPSTSSFHAKPSHISNDDLLSQEAIENFLSTI